MDRRVLLAGAVSLLALKACGKGGSSTSSTSPRPGGGGEAPKAPSPIGYSNVATLDAAQADFSLSHGLTLVQAEVGPFGGSDFFDINRLKGIAAVSRRYNATFLITLVNWNGPARFKSTALFREQVREIAQEIGPAGVWFEGVAEPDNESAKARDWQHIAVAEWPGFTVGNGHRGRGTPIVRTDLVDWHYCRVADLVENVGRGGRLHSTDCTPVLASNLSEAVVRDVTQKAIQARTNLIMYDTDTVPGQNAEVIRWMSTELS